MSYWDSRVIRKRHSDSNGATYQIHEVYYADNGSVEHWTEDSVQPFGETAEELREEIRLFLRVFRRPILEWKEVGGKEALIPDEDDSPINEGHYFEFMDRASVAVDYAYQFLGSHPLFCFWWGVQHGSGSGVLLRRNVSDYARMSDPMIFLHVKEMS
ncbi:hypothetical protein [Candidatus Manganitrophus noduliformans]|uniref:Uncharacterized protein n=1 Tax=Candidatus Manganitrophus noduliformans TaxID=2606439 RepID=A0A7X6DT37_9BACT|nr:hypothetical protein [Candidatus Manganitrophus noduliformans]NKE72887.1 hypothetical protein [Candidatus Manganitrophus noduliformans]